MPSIEIRGLEELYAKLDRMAATATLRPPMMRGVLRLQRRLGESRCRQATEYGR